METETDPTAALHVSVVNGNLRFVRPPLMLGHYRAMALTGTERVMDELIGGAMSASLRLGQYPDTAAAHEVFINTARDPANPLQLPRPKAVIVVGLGDEGALRAADLARTVRQGVIAWAKRTREAGTAAPARFELAATLIGSGGTGIGAGQSASLVVDGVLDANRRLAQAGWPAVGELKLVELYLDRATEAWQALRAAGADAGEIRLHEAIGEAAGALRRPPDAGYRGARYDLITAVSIPGGQDDEGIAYTVDTKRARTEVHAQAMQRPLLRDLVAKSSNDRTGDPRLGRTLFRLLVPVELEPFLAGAGEAVIELDRGTAGIPWEMLDAGGEKPWAISTRLLRKLRMPDFRPRVVDATADGAVLVIGEPVCDPERYPRLPSALKEAAAVTELLEPRAQVTGLFNPDPAKVGANARAVINTLLERDWRIVHITGHGEPPVPSADGAAGDARGVVLSDGIFLGAREIRSMRVVPELVFVNCCHLGVRDDDGLLCDGAPPEASGYDRARFAAGLAEALIQVGVRCVVAAGWAVEDEAARTFATTFYERLAGGSRFIDAVAAARDASRGKGGNTWAAYQCYGDPDWTFVRHEAGAPPEPAPPEVAFAGVASVPALTLALETLAVNAQFDGAEKKALSGRLAYLEQRFEAPWGGLGEVADAFGRAWTECDRVRAIAWYGRALAANDGRASFRAAEQLGNLRVRLAWDSVDPGKPANAASAAAGRAERIAAARAEIAAGLDLLERVAAIHPTVERESLCGSAWKRRAQVEALAGNAAAEADAIARMRKRYESAWTLARGTGERELYYPGLNRIATELVTDAGSPGWPGFDPAALDEVRAALQARMDDDPEFWSAVGLIELRLYEAVARGGLAAERAWLEHEYIDLHNRVGSEWRWASANDQLRFVLSRYGARAAAAEREASDALAGLLESYARGNAPT